MAVSRAVRVPSRTDRDFHEDGGAQLVRGIPVELDVYGSTSMRSEIAWTAEAGHRFQAGQRWSVDSSVFWTWYSRLRTLDMPAQPEVDYSSGTPVLRFRMTEQNGATGRAYGGEAWLTWQVRPGWKLIPSYSYLNEVFWKPPADAWLVQSSSSPHQGLLRSQFDIARHLQLDVMARTRSRNTAFDLPGVLLLDMRLGWRPDGDTEISIAVNNLTGRSVLETYAEGPFAAIPLERTFVLKCVRRF
jgi:iron complex outermembrane receptor protein